MHIINTYLHETFVDHVAIELHNILNSINELFEDFEGIDELREAIQDHGGGDTDKGSWVRNKIVQSAIIMLDHYGVEIEETTPLDVIIGLLKPILRFSEPEVRDMWDKVDTSELDNEQTYLEYAGLLYVFDGYPLANIISVKDHLIAVFKDDSEMETEVVIKNTRDDLRRSLLRMPSELGEELLGYRLPLGMKIIDYIRIFMTNDQEEERSDESPEKYVTDLYMLSHFCSDNPNDFIPIVNKHLDERFTDSPELLTLNYYTKKIEDGRNA